MKKDFDQMIIHCKFSGYGYVATSPKAPGESTRKCGGPKEAAEMLADKMLGRGAYKLTRRSYKVYEANPILEA
jgi:hypothetical protein